MAFVQEGRLCTMKAPEALGADYFSVRRVEGEEGISCPFRFMLDLASDSKIEAEFDKMIGQSITLLVDLADGEKRQINGIVDRFSQVGKSHDTTSYRAEIVPWLWLLTRRTDCRMFQEKTVPEILEIVFGVLPNAKYDLRLEGTYEPWDYCVQYRETDFNFVSRLMEQEGIFYYFEQPVDTFEHVMVIADSPEKIVDCPGQVTAKYDSEAGVTTDEDVVTGWLLEQQLLPTKHTLNDFSFIDPATSLQVSATSSITAGANEKLEFFDYPGDYVKMGAEKGSNLDRGDARIKILKEEADATAMTISGGGCCRPFSVGHRFELTGHYRADCNQAYMLTRVRHLLEQEAAAGSGTDIESRYENQFTCVQHTIPYRPPRMTAKPVIQGPQTAMVVGQADEEIYTDEHGRVKVQFHWDRQAESDEKSSCWIRVAQVWAGKNWGGIFIPRIGNEVIVDFLEGDPDRPLITGSVYNAVSTPPYTLPDNATQSGFMTLTSKDGGGYNEIRFEDKKDSEEIFIHGQRNIDINAENDRRELISNDRHLIVKKDKYEHVQNNRQETVDADHIEKIGKDRHLKVVSKEAKEVEGSLSLTVGGDVIQVFKANAGTEVSGDLGLKGTNLVLEGLASITLVVGGSSLVVDSSGVTATGTTVTLDGGTTNINSGPGSSAESYSWAGAVAPTDPELPAEAGTTQAGSMADVEPHKPVASSIEQEDVEDEEKEVTWIEIEVIDADDVPVPGVRYRLELPGGKVSTGSTDEKGKARVEGVEPGDCTLTLPDQDKDTWEKA